MRFNVTGFQLDPMPRIFWAHLILWEISFGKAVIWLDGCKKLFVFPQYQYLEASDQVGTPLRWSARTHSVFYGTICQDWCSRLDVTWLQSLFAKLNYSSANSGYRHLLKTWNFQKFDIGINVTKLRKWLFKTNIKLFKKKNLLIRIDLVVLHRLGRRWPFVPGGL